MGEKPLISVLNITNRAGGMDILRANMARQTFTDFELVIVDGRWRKRRQDVKDYFVNFPLTYVRQSEKRKGAYSNLAHADNEGFSACQGELIVLLQDYIWIPPLTLSKFWEAHQALGGKALISGIGHQYAKPGKEQIEQPEGLITIFAGEYRSEPTEICWRDPRVRTDQGTFYESQAQDWEANFAAIPRAVIYDLGGMDEEYDMVGFAYDNVNIAQRAVLAGYKTYLDQTNECKAFAHDLWNMSAGKKERASEIAQFHLQRMKNIIEGKFPLRLDYLAEKRYKESKGESSEKEKPDKI